MHRTARDHERAVSLVPLLDRLPDTVMALMREATRLAQPSRPTAHPDAPATPLPTAEDVRLTDHGEPPVPSTPAPAQPSAPDTSPGGMSGDAEAPVPPRVVRLVEPTRLEASLAATVAELGTEIRAYLAAHPSARIQVSWQPVDGTPSDGATGPATEPGDGNAS
uniref:hypothetical protein n=1 Tax=Streptomyces sp. rh45 TaxID=3028726 RepID=UPI003C7CEFA9